MPGFQTSAPPPGPGQSCTAFRATRSHSSVTCTGLINVCRCARHHLEPPGGQPAPCTRLPPPPPPACGPSGGAAGAGDRAAGGGRCARWGSAGRRLRRSPPPPAGRLPLVRESLPHHPSVMTHSLPADTCFTCPALQAPWTRRCGPSLWVRAAAVVLGDAQERLPPAARVLCKARCHAGQAPQERLFPHCCRRHRGDRRLLRAVCRPQGR